MEQYLFDELEFDGQPELLTKRTNDITKDEKGSLRILLDASGMPEESQRYKIKDDRSAGKLNLPIQSLSKLLKVIGGNPSLFELD